ncbi:cytidylyltransferase domain-containing protein [Metabacillus halosaccharovorans]|uniref:acylneuraminate cytidylyltransferase family protein n=1 Tax=Metabacillus halosaccharovorans TaxID=930124 RepID=UPI001C1FF36D|nr:acylneuraminate cytidylyltransferase family protein [Metabacillus halosaccharovorans]
MVDVLVIIPARGGSKRLPRKNILPLINKPLIEYTINAAKNSKVVNRLMVSTDDEEIAKYATSAGAEVPALRPSHLAKDDSTSVDVCLHTLAEYQKNEGYEPDIIVLLQPTSPLRTEKHIDEALEILETNNADSVISVCPVEYSPNTLINIKQDGSITPYFSKSIIKKLQEEKFVCRLNGAIYAVKTEFLKKNKSFYSKNTFPYVMSPTSSIDIDTELDFQFASFLMEKA